MTITAENPTQTADRRVLSYSPLPTPTEILGELTIITDTGHEHRTTPTGPLAHARNHILDQQWQHHLDHLIAHDGHLTNPPGSTRRTRRT